MQVERAAKRRCNSRTRGDTAGAGDRENAPRVQQQGIVVARAPWYHNFVGRILVAVPQRIAGGREMLLETGHEFAFISVGSCLLVNQNQAITSHRSTNDQRFKAPEVREPESNRATRPSGKNREVSVEDRVAGIAVVEFDQNVASSSPPVDFYARGQSSTRAGLQRFDFLMNEKPAASLSKILPHVTSFVVGCSARGAFFGDLCFSWTRMKLFGVRSAPTFAVQNSAVFL